MAFRVEVTVTPGNQVVGGLSARRTGPLRGYDEEHTYVITYPALFEGVTFKHRYSDPWLVFVQKMVQAALASERAKKLPKSPKPRNLMTVEERLDEETIEYLRTCVEATKG